MTTPAMTAEQRRNLFEAIRVQRYRMGWNDAMHSRTDPRLALDMAYRAGYADAHRPR